MPDIKTSVSSVVHYVKTGTGPVLVLLHGFPESGNLWRTVRARLAAHFTLIIPDLPGSGGSTLEQDTGIYDMADCVAEILDHEKIDRAVIAGHSMGGYVGFAFARRYPHKTLGLSLVHSTPAPDDEEKKKIRLKAIGIIQNGGKTAFIRQMVANFFSASYKQAHPDIVEEQVAGGVATPDESLINYYYAMINREDQRMWLENTSIPIQWVIGMEDNVIYYKNILANCTKSGINFVTFYHNCGHMAMFEATDSLINDLTSFVYHCNG